MFKLLNLYIRREPNALRNSGPLVGTRSAAHDLVLYRDQDATQQAGCYPWHGQSKPNRRSKRVMHNCWPFALVWLDDLKFESEQALQAHRTRMNLHLPPGTRSFPVTDSNGVKLLLVTTA